MNKETLIMLQETIKINSTCDSEMHSEHLCYIISQGFHLANEQEYNALVEDVRYICNHCNRTARSADNLCVPVLL
ncbi:MAG: hypothetical protein RQ760_09580 [Sedimentisphaerales bacterium]|nr:hypothetical protein [Sedimentisphaerales bacterium]